MPFPLHTNRILFWAYSFFSILILQSLAIDLRPLGLFVNNHKDIDIFLILNNDIWFSAVFSSISDHSFSTILHLISFYFFHSKCSVGRLLFLSKKRVFSLLMSSSLAQALLFHFSCHTVLAPLYSFNVINHSSPFQMMIDIKKIIHLIFLFFNCFPANLITLFNLVRNNKFNC